MSSRDEKPGVVYVYTDGSSLNNPGGPGGWCAVLRYCDPDTNEQSQKVISGRVVGDEVTNNRMEILAAVEGLKAVKSNRIPVVVFTDSIYLRDSISKWIYKWRKNGWRTSDGKPVKNADLFRSLMSVMGARKIQFKHIPGHIARYEWNNLADRTAGNAARGNV